MIFGSSKVPEIGILVAKRFLGWLRNSLETPATTLSQRQLQWVFPCIPEINNRNIVKDGFDVASQLSGGERYSQGDQNYQDNEGHLKVPRENRKIDIETFAGRTAGGSS